MESEIFVLFHTLIAALWLQYDIKISLVGEIFLLFGSY